VFRLIAKLIAHPVFESLAFVLFFKANLNVFVSGFHLKPLGFRAKVYTRYRLSGIVNRIAGFMRTKHYPITLILHEHALQSLTLYWRIEKSNIRSS
jgi:hypothetical protein